ncbi:hypothetical protein GCM10023347_46610 [Streptomyces chumphonensis]|uniref:Uncharacterized protein n=1 Tax=Streptomyces chumphonensis TaxID=1214925 RepID=A0A927EZY5_9ACTN|nr:hypothetical protein [Streptomyces chumphonensis]MBD3932838.1 hypothetical protein [Streptomyces chumphonensis]
MSRPEESHRHGRPSPAPLTDAVPDAPAPDAAPAAGVPPQARTTEAAAGAARPAAPGGRGRRRRSASRHGPGGVAERTGSPIIEPGPEPAALTLVLAALLALAAPLGNLAVLVPLLLLQALTAAGWYRLNGMWPARQGIALAFLAGVSADVALLAAPAEHTDTALLGTLGIWVLLVLLLQLRNHSAPEERLYALTAGVAATVLTVFAAGFLATVDVRWEAVTAGAAAVGAGVLLRALPLPGPLTAVLALAGAVGAGVVAGGIAGLDGTGFAALVGVTAGVCALVGLRAASYDWPSRFVHRTAGVALPLALAAPAVHVLAVLA